MTPVRIFNFRTKDVLGAKTRLVAKFDCDIGPVRIRCAHMRKFLDTGEIRISPPGRNATEGISVFRDSPEWIEIERQALEEYKCLKQH